jgi:hypothetical protein
MICKSCLAKPSLAMTVAPAREIPKQKNPSNLKDLKGCTQFLNP